MKKYKIKTRCRSDLIERVEVLRETKNFVVLPRAKNYWKGELELRVQKIGEYYIFYDTWDEARSALVAQAEMHVEQSVKQLQAANAFFEAVKAIGEEEK